MWLFDTVGLLMDGSVLVSGLGDGARLCCIGYHNSVRLGHVG